MRFLRIVGIPLCCVAVAIVAIATWGGSYRIGEYELLAFVAAVYVAVVSGGKWRSSATVIASLALGLACIEIITARTTVAPARTTKGFMKTDPVLGWAPAAAGTYHAHKEMPDGSVIYDTDYTIDASRLRQTLSAPSGREVAFFGDSFTFGEGMRDADTLPQIFADLDQRRHRVLNFGVPGYGPQQFLRAMETGLDDNLLTNVSVFVFQTSPWHAERASCLRDYVARAPRYELQAGIPVYQGACKSGLALAYEEFVGKVATLQRLLMPAMVSIGPKDIDLYVAEVIRAAELAKAKYGAPTVILYIPAGDAYLAKLGMTDTEIEERFRKAGLLVLDGGLPPSDFVPGTVLELPGDGHPTAIAHRARAQRLYEFLKKNLPDTLAAAAVN